MVMHTIHFFHGRLGHRVPFFLISLIALLMLAGTVCPKAWSAKMLKVGILEEPKTLNIWLASDAWSRKVLRLMYQTLYIRDPETLELIPWLAQEDPVYDAEANTYTVKLREAKWSDGSEITSEDIAFTGQLIQEFKIPRYASKWKFIEKIETPDKKTVIFYLKEPKAIFLSRTLTTPIVSKKEWSEIVKKARQAEKPLVTLLNYEVKNPVASGPFVLKEWRQGSYLFLKANESFFGKDQDIAGRRLGPYMDGVIFKVFGTSDAAILALKKSTIDFFWWKIQPGYLEDLRGEKDIQLFSNEKSALYYMGFNCRKPPFDDVHLRRAAAVLIDRDFIIRRVLQGQAIKMISVIPPGNKFWHSSDVPLYGQGLTTQERIKKAYDILHDAGYSWKVPPIDKNGKVVEGKGLKLPSGEQMKNFTILTPPADYDPHRAMSGLLIQEWLKAIGMPATSRPMAFGALLEKVKVTRDFDTFVLGYGSLSPDPDYMRAFYHSRYDKARGFNKTGYKNPDFDKIADESAGAMDPKKRQELVWAMQKMILTDVPIVPLYNPKLIEAVRTERFQGWVEMLNGIGNLWSFCQIKPN
ncbi:MAG: ABC transporter substrate-binding protein [Thermodesulfobacteriota bacterium]|nr:ABC transporter substrate-binding protein [Thermodesulfobacteriota bacterium]